MNWFIIVVASTASQTLVRQARAASDESSPASGRGKTSQVPRAALRKWNIWSELGSCRPMMSMALLSSWSAIHPIRVVAGP